MFEKRKSKQILCPVTFFSFENHAVCEVMWTDTMEPGQHTDDNKVHAHSLLGN